MAGHEPQLLPTLGCMKAILIVDVQRDFTEGGALACEGGANVAGAITDYLRTNASDYHLVAASRDWHNPGEDNGGHFASEPDFIDTWPVHCVAGSEGAQYHPNLDQSLIEVEVHKGMGEPAYSAFEGRSEGGQNLEQVLKERGVDQLDIVGIAADYCVKASAADALKAGFRVRILSDLTAAVNAAGAKAAFADLEKEGVRIETAV
ncbi:MAG: isochorismatase family protein [Actinomycetaceae bacterium]|nr:isochorismatase family protein [Actinomycetaceae bacterium]